MRSLIDDIKLINFLDVKNFFLLNCKMLKNIKTKIK